MISDDEIENEGAGHMTEGEVGKSRISMSPLTDQGVMWSQVVDPVSQRNEKVGKAEENQSTVGRAGTEEARPGTDQEPMCAVHVAR